MTETKTTENKFSGLLWAAAGILLLAMLFARAVYPENLWLTLGIGIPLIGALAGLIQQNRKALRSRTAAYGVNSVVTVVLVIAIIGVLNFMAAKYPFKTDLTKNKVHTLSDQTVKLVKGLTKPVKAVVFTNAQGREQVRPLLDNYKALNPKFDVEYVDPTREPTRAKQAGIKRLGTVALTVGNRDSKVEEASEEKITNALIKLLKEKVPSLCALTGHGEKSFNSQEPEGYSQVRKALTDQSYEVKDVNLAQEGKLPENCDAIAVVGPMKSLFEPEVKMIREYLANGGRAIIASDLNIKGGELSPEISQILQDWYVKPAWAVIVDPLSRMFGVDAAAPIVATYSKEHAITRDFQANSMFPFVRPLDVMPGAPAELKVQWIGQTTPKSWAVTDPKQLASGEVKFSEGKDRQGPLSIAVAVEGKQKDSKAPRNTRLVAFGSSHFATNNYSRFGGNLDLFLNAASWVMEDESLISIRAKEDEAGKIELSQKAGSAIFLTTVILIPLLTAITGVVIWVRRRKL